MAPNLFDGPKDWQNCLSQATQSLDLISDGLNTRIVLADCLGSRVVIFCGEKIQEAGDTTYEHSKLDNLKTADPLVLLQTIPTKHGGPKKHVSQHVLTVIFSQTALSSVINKRLWLYDSQWAF